MKPEQKHGEPKSGPQSGHSAKEDLVRFMAGDLPPAETRAVVRHLLRGCPICSRETSKIWKLGEQPLRHVPSSPALQVGVWQ